MDVTEVSTGLQKAKKLAKPEELIEKMQLCDRVFRRACSQILILNRKISSLIVRYNRAVLQRKRAFPPVIRLQICVFEGVRDVFAEYARLQCQVMEDLQNTYKEITGEEYENFEDFN